MSTSDPDFLKLVGQAIELRVQLAVKAVTVPLFEKISALESRIADLDDRWTKDMEAVRGTFSSYVMLEDFDKAKDGKDGIDGKDGKDVDPEAVVALIDQFVKDHFDNHPVQHGKDGLDGKDGVDGKDGKDGTSISLDDVNSLVCDSVDKQLSSWPRPKDGEDGKPGRDGTDGKDGKSVEAADLVPLVSDLVGRAVAAIPVPVSVVSGLIDRDGCLHHVLSDGSKLSLGKVVGRDGNPGKDGDPGKDGVDGKDGKDGKDGLGFKDMQVTFDGERDFLFKFALEERVEELALTVPFQLYQGVWKAGAYRRGDTVTREGSQWVALRDTDCQPGTVDSGWQLSVKRGRDGKDGSDGKPGPKGDKGDPGRDGRDLTQMGPDGSKW